MVLSEAQLETWSHLYETSAAANAHLAIRSALERQMSPAWFRQVDAHLQGSYRNKTSIFRDSDVDLVLEWTGNFYYSLNSLSANEQQSFVSDHSADSVYNFAMYRADVVRALVSEFGADKVDSTGNYAIRVMGEPGRRLDADVVPCFLYRHYWTYNSSYANSYVSGMTFWTQRENRQVVNYPKLHIANGETKNGATAEWYKKTIRMYKNARNDAEQSGLLGEEIAPSYFIECLLYNVPNGQFGRSCGASFRESINWLVRQTDKSAFMCQNGVIPLFGATHEQWQQAKASRLVDSLVQLYNAG